MSPEQKADQFWSELADHLDFQRHSGQSLLVGYTNKLLTIIRLALYKPYQANFPIIAIIIRHKELLDLKATNKLITSDSELNTLLGKMFRRINEKVIIQGTTTTYVTLRFDWKKQVAKDLASRIQAIIRILSKYLHPIPENTCDLSDCLNPYDPTKSTLVFFNGIPMLVHPACLIKLNDVGEKNRQRYKHQKSNFLQFILLSCGISFSAILILCITFGIGLLIQDKTIQKTLVGGAFIGTFALSFYPLLLLWLAVQVQTKFTIYLGIAFGVISYFTVLFCLNFLRIVEYLVRSDIIFSFDLLLQIWNMTLQSKIYNNIITLTSLVCIWALFQVYIKYRQDSKLVFEPEVEIWRPASSDQLKKTLSD